MPYRVFLLSPAFAGGRRAQLLFSDRAGFDLARALQRGEARPTGEVFSFLSGLYFRGKLAYARAFGTAPEGGTAAWVITTSEGLVPVDTPMRLDDLRRAATVPIDEADERYAKPLRLAAARLADESDCEYVLLGSISTGKYVNVLLEAFGGRLLFPTEFVGRGDMSRGSLLLRAARDGRELEYAPVAGATRRGPRPPRLPPASWGGDAASLQSAAKTRSRR